MKLILTNEDEYKAVKGKLSADVFLMGDGSAEVALDPDSVDRLKTEKAQCGRIDAFAKAVSKSLKKKNVQKIYMTADQTSVISKALDMSKNAALDYSEYMFKKEADENNVAKEDEESCIVLDTKSSEDTDIEQKNAILVKSKEEGVFSAKIMPYKDGMYVYEVEVAEALRHNGYGTKHMEALIRAFSDGPIYLQVSSKNTPAIGLYKKLGFNIATGINYYTV